MVETIPISYKLYESYTLFGIVTSSYYFQIHGLKIFILSLRLFQRKLYESYTLFGIVIIFKFKSAD